MMIGFKIMLLILFLLAVTVSYFIVEDIVAIFNRKK